MRIAVIATCLAVFASPAIAQQADEPKQAEKPQDQAASAKKDDEICKFIRTDMSSRRKEKVCMTAEEWVRFNRGD